jgi:hypothetical protein
LAITYVAPAGSCQAGSDEVDIFSPFVDILAVGNLDVDIGTFVRPQPPPSIVGCHGNSTQLNDFCQTLKLNFNRFNTETYQWSA